MTHPPQLVVRDWQLKRLADDLHDMQDRLERQIRHMGAIVDRIETGWRGPAGKAYRSFHRGVAEDAVRIRHVMQLIERAVRLSKDGFTEQELEVLQSFRQMKSEIDVAAEARDLSTPAPDPAPAAPRSRSHDL